MDIYGKGLLAYLKRGKNAAFIVESDIAETEEWAVSLFFRNYEDMPEAEKKALNRVQGSVLDIGAGAGSHALWLQGHGKEVTALDISPGAIEVMKERGVRKIINQDFYTLKGQKFDTLLLLMNGIGIAGKLAGLSRFFKQAKELLHPGGKILLDSSDLIYLFEDECEDDGSILFDLTQPYYGEIMYKFIYDNEEGQPFHWLFVDFQTLSEYAAMYGFSCNKIYEDEHYLYLAELNLL